MAAQRRASRRKGCRRNNQKGGAGEAYTFGSHVAGSPIINNYGQEVVRFPSCESAVRPGYIEDAQIKGGLPGFAQRGGRYTNEFNVVNGVGIMEPTYSGCGTGMEAISNPLNKGDLSSLITAPAPLVQPPTPGSGDQLQKGGRHRKTRKTNQYGGVGGVDSMVYSAPRAGWTTFPSNAQGGDAGTLSDGKTPFLINVPYSAQPTPSLACLKTGGGSRKRFRKASKKSRKSSKKSRRASKKSRKASKKSRRTSKKSRKSCRKNRK
jgi:hypothetical protein